MADLLTVAEVAPPTASLRLHDASRRMAGRLALLLRDLDPQSAVADWLTAMAGDVPTTTWDGTCLGPPASPVDPVDRVASGAALLPAEVDLLVLAGLAEEHEAVAAALRRLHPAGAPHPTAGLAAQLAERGLLASLDSRPALRAVLLDGPATTAGVLRLGGDGALWDRSLLPSPGLWDALHGATPWPADVQALDLPTVLDGLADWLARPAAEAAARALAQDAPVTVVVHADRPLAALGRALALVTASGLTPAPLAVPGDPTTARAAALVALARGLVPVLLPAASTVPVLDGVPVPVVVCVADDVVGTPSDRAVLTVSSPPLDRAARRALWDAVADAGAGEERPPCPSGLEPVDVALLRRELRAQAAVGSPGAAAASVLTAASSNPCPGAVLIHPRAGWDDLVLPVDAMDQLHEAAARGAHEATVLGAWGFLAGRPGAAGLRLLFCGPPGTGKTLAAEVLARELERDLLVVDLSQLVSKWIGETEKNLAAAFDAAERGDCVLFFDEADALFGKRTEVGDARDRYANLETAYLLGRLERFDGVAVLATNLRQNIDAAFGRRLEFVVPFDPPGPAERLLLWRRHLPPGAPLADDVDLDELAAVYAVVGGHIRNASVAAAYLAAAEDGPIGRAHLLHALSREYDKAGQAFPGSVPDRFDSPGLSGKDPRWPE